MQRRDERGMILLLLYYILLCYYHDELYANFFFLSLLDSYATRYTPCIYYYYYYYVAGGNRKSHGARLQQFSVINLLSFPGAVLRNDIASLSKHASSVTNETNIILLLWRCTLVVPNNNISIQQLAVSGVCKKKYLICNVCEINKIGKHILWGEQNSRFLKRMF